MSTRSAAGAVTFFTAATLVVGLTFAGTPAPQTVSANTITTDASAGYAEGAPPGFSGGFGEQSCHACHFHADLNAGPGQVTIAGVPQRFVAGERYPLTVTLERSGMRLGGFQLTARFKDGGAQAGTLVPAPGEEERVGIDVQADVQYVSQRKKGTGLVSPDLARWTLVWTAPKTSGPIVFHIAANAANADETAEGDYVHTAVAESLPSDQPTHLIFLPRVVRKHGELRP